MNKPDSTVIDMVVDTPELVRRTAGNEHSRKPTMNLTLGLTSNVGEGIGRGLSAGGQHEHTSIDTDFYVPVSVYSDKGSRKTLWRHFMLDRPKPGFIAVGKNGNRFTNEAASCHAFTLACSARVRSRSF